MTKDSSSEEEEEESEEEKHHQQQEEEEQETFYESLDRILSSSNSSTSTSEDDTDAAAVVPAPSPRSLPRRCFHGKPKPKPKPKPKSKLKSSTSTSSSSPSPSSSSSSSWVPKLPMSARNYDVWISSESFSLSSIEQRRDRLLRALGVSSDPALSRRKSHDLGRSDTLGPGSPINRSKSEGGPVPDHCNSSPAPAVCSTSSGILSIRSVSDTVNRNSGDINNNIDNNNNDNDNDDDNDNVKQKDDENNNCNDGVVVVVDNLVGSNKRPPLDSSVIVGESSSTSSSGNGNVNGVVEKVDRVCRIKNLDNGKEFVVNEVREDGMWGKVKEVGTGRQLTMEEFEMCVGHSPIVQELMRRQNVEDQRNGSKDGSGECNGNGNGNGNGENRSKSKKKVSWLRSIRNVASSVTGYRERRSSDERDTSSEKGGRRSSSATDDSQDGSFNGPERVRVRQYGKSVKELTALYKSQEIQAHNGSIWTIKFSLDGRYLASAGEDCVIHVWQVVESERKGELLMDRPDDGSLNLLFLTNGSPEPSSVSPSVENPLERKRRGRTSISRKSVSLDHIVVPETVFGLSEKPICSFQGHSDDVLDLSWSKSQLLLSSSMDKTVRLWNMSSKTCLKVFSHSDYVTCIQFNPVDDRYFISGSLDAKVRIWSIPDRQVVDWNDLHEMVTAAYYTPGGQGALVGSYKGSCRLYNTSENKLQQKCLINLQNKKKKSHLKKITGFQFAPGSSSEVLITSADSQVRVVDGVDLVHKFKDA